MLSGIVDDFVSHGNSIVTSSANNGTTSLLLYLSNILLREDKKIIYYDAYGGIDREFVKQYYPRVFTDTLFFTGSISELLDMLEWIEYDLDVLILDPADIFMINHKLLPNITNLVNENKGIVICSSQIRQDPSLGRQVYSTIEKLNEKYHSFHYSIWLRNTSGESLIFSTKYVDVFEQKRQGNNYIARYIARFSEKDGYIVG